MRYILFFCIVLTICISCQPINTSVIGGPYQDDSREDEQEEVEGTREWTFIIYMAADNDLESGAIADFNELEAVKYGLSPVSTLVLLDRSPAYDMTNGNWTDTRLFEVTTDPRGVTSTIQSTRLDCVELGLSKDTETELNMADPLVLSRFIDFSKRNYPAEHYALFVWGHGTGWRGGEDTDSLPMPLKAMAFDDTQGQYMSLSTFERAVRGKGLELIGFDTCYGAILEVAYQLKTSARLFIGSEGEILSTGWDYTSLFTDFLGKSSLSVSNLGNSIQAQFAAQYAGFSNASISQVELREADELFVKFNDFAGVIAESITTLQSRKAVLDEILHTVESYYFTSFPSDLYIDIFDFSQKIMAIRSNITGDIERQDKIAAAAGELTRALERAILSSWAANGTKYKMGIHVIPLQGVAVPTAAHELPYIRGSISIDKSAFVENSSHWAPNTVPQYDSLLDKLFYWDF